MRRLNSVAVNTFILSLSLLLHLGCVPAPSATSPTLSTPRSDQKPDLDTLTPFPINSPTVNQTFPPTVMYLNQSIMDTPIATIEHEEKCSGAYDTEIFPLSWNVDDAIKTLDPKAEGWAEATIQYCAKGSNKNDFNVFRVWFYVDKPTSDLNDYEYFGNWIQEVMNLLDTIPRDESNINAESIEVNFRFYVHASVLDVCVPIQQYYEIAKGKSGEELFLLFYQP